MDELRSERKWLSCDTHSHKFQSERLLEVMLVLVPVVVGGFTKQQNLSTKQPHPFTKQPHLATHQAMDSLRPVLRWAW